MKPSILETVSVILCLPFLYLAANAASAVDFCSKGQLALQSSGYEAAITEWEQSALDKSPKERLHADIDCLHDTKVAVTREDAFAWLLKRANEGIPSAQLYVGMMYASGVGVKRSLYDARYWMTYAKRSGDPDAPFMLGVLDHLDAHPEEFPNDTGGH